MAPRNRRHSDAGSRISLLSPLPTTTIRALPYCLGKTAAASPLVDCRRLSTTLSEHTDTRNVFLYSSIQSKRSLHVGRLCYSIDFLLFACALYRHERRFTTEVSRSEKQYTLSLHGVLPVRQLRDDYVVCTRTRCV